MPNLVYEAGRDHFERYGARWPDELGDEWECTSLSVSDKSSTVYGRGGMVSFGPAVLEYEAEFRSGHRAVLMKSADGQRWFKAEENATYGVDMTPPEPRRPRGRPRAFDRAEAEAQVEELGAQLDQMELPK
jgi:hypothetical protein